ncbi:hypothetical protein V475_05880 [Sphingobium baderi LL03]|uniref:Uncharacterized protein n=2 Tax=Sphingobium TaxID=165695 RepID=T0GUP9_9SPHN|nr:MULTISPECIES: hypothetical protein [Sphingobium]EQB04387.1 hypothetical protein L485_04005 [Sphingobium baderi LL03]KMS62960.1 hypothetical protein V475_05880 [Sphingobium baderi LL03]TWH90470.1 hypothetical protein IQ35_03406 [Sphingobium wenxiniae]
MYRRSSHSKSVTLMLHDAAGGAWHLRLSDDCLRFIGRYRRVEGFHVDAMMLFEGLRKSG